MENFFKYSEKCYLFADHTKIFESWQLQTITDKKTNYCLVISLMEMIFHYATYMISPNTRKKVSHKVRYQPQKIKKMSINRFTAHFSFIGVGFLTTK